MSHWRNTSNHAMVVSAVCETRIHIKDICFTAGLMENQTTPEVCNIRRPSPSMSMVLGEVTFMVMLAICFSVNIHRWPSGTRDSTTSVPMWCVSTSCRYTPSHPGRSGSPCL